MRMVHHEKRTTWHGSVTVFFSLTGVLILCLLLAVVEAVRIQGAKAQTASLEGVANFSVLAEYEKNLLEEFEIFALDGAGGSGSFQIQKIFSISISAFSEYIIFMFFDIFAINMLSYCPAICHIHPFL